MKITLGWPAPTCSGANVPSCHTDRFAAGAVETVHGPASHGITGSAFFAASTFEFASLTHKSASPAIDTLNIGAAAMADMSAYNVTRLALPCGIMYGAAKTMSDILPTPETAEATVKPDESITLKLSNTFDMDMKAKRKSCAYTVNPENSPPARVPPPVFTMSN